MSRKIRYRRFLEAQKRGWWKYRFIERLRKSESFKRLVKKIAGDWSTIPKNTGRTLSLKH